MSDCRATQESLLGAGIHPAGRCPCGAPWFAHECTAVKVAKVHVVKRSRAAQLPASPVTAATAANGSFAVGMSSTTEWSPPLSINNGGKKVVTVSRPATEPGTPRLNDTF